LSGGNGPEYSSPPPPPPPSPPPPRCEWYPALWIASPCSYGVKFRSFLSRLNDLTACLFTGGGLARLETPFRERSFSIDLRYSPVWLRDATEISPRESAGFRMLRSPGNFRERRQTRVCNSSHKDDAVALISYFMMASGALQIVRETCVRQRSVKDRGREFYVR